MHSRIPLGVSPRLEGKQRTPLSSRVAKRISWSPLVASMESSLLFILERGLGIVLQAMQEKKSLHIARTGASQGFPRAAAPVGVFSQGTTRISGASRAALGKPGLHGGGEGERVFAFYSREGTRASRHVEEGLSRSFSGGDRKPSFPSTSAGDLRELPREPLRGEGCCGVGGASGD